MPSELFVRECLINKLNCGVLHQLPATSGYIKSKQQTFTLTIYFVTQEARKIVSAQFQVITYVEWLPIILSDEAMTEYGLKSTVPFEYREDVDATIANSFSTATFRFGHSEVKQQVKV